MQNWFIDYRINIFLERQIELIGNNHWSILSKCSIDFINELWISMIRAECEFGNSAPESVDFAQHTPHMLVC